MRGLGRRSHRYASCAFVEISESQSDDLCTLVGGDTLKAMTKLLNVFHLHMVECVEQHWYAGTGNSG